jgi:predicted MFS family arabinose efflux permease
MPNNKTQALHQYLLITANYWAFTLTDGALRMLVVLYFHQLGYSPLSIASLFLFYEFFGCVTNLIGGWIGARIGLNRTMNIGLALQIIALLALALPAQYLTIALVMGAQAISGIAKDLNKMSAKSSIKALVNRDSQNAESTLYKWVALLTGSKNTLKGVGFFIGAALLSSIGFQQAVIVMAALLTVIWIFSVVTLKKGLGRSTFKPKFSQIFFKNRAINILSAARMFLFGARDVWFVVALPVFLSEVCGWSFSEVGSFFALWIIGYGVVQTFAPAITKFSFNKNSPTTPRGGRAVIWAALLAVIPATIALNMDNIDTLEQILVGGLILFGILFAINSSLHSYLITSFASREHISLDIGFYYMANAMGRLIGTILSGWIYQRWGLEACLYVSSLFILLAAIISFGLPRNKKSTSVTP